MWISFDRVEIGNLVAACNKFLHRGEISCYNGAMSAIEQATALLNQMDRKEKIRLLHLISTDGSLHSNGISITPGVCGGSACIRGTRIPVWLLEALRRDGANDDRLLEAYPQLTPEDLRNAAEFTAQNRELIDEDIRENSEDSSLED